MGLREELTEPWGLVVSGMAGGLAWAVASGSSVALALGVGVAGAVYGVKVLAGSLGRRGSTDRPQFPRPRKGSPAEVWLRRAEKAVATLHEQTESAREPTVRAQVADIDDQAAEMLDTLRRLGAQVVTVEDALYRINVPQLRADRARLRGELGVAGSAELRAEHERATAAVTEQLAVAGRLTEVRDTLLARMQSTAIGLEGLIAGLAEVLAMSATAGGIDLTAGRITELSDELDGLRLGLAETERLSRTALGAQPPTPPAGPMPPGLPPPPSGAPPGPATPPG